MAGFGNFGNKSGTGLGSPMNNTGSGTGTQTSPFAGVRADQKDRKRRMLPDSNRFNRNPAGRMRGRG